MFVPFLPYPSILQCGQLTRLAEKLIWFERDFLGQTVNFLVVRTWFVLLASKNVGVNKYSLGSVKALSLQICSIIILNSLLFIIIVQNVVNRQKNRSTLKKDMYKCHGMNNYG